MLDLRSLKIYIDGSCLKNPGGPGGFAARLEFPFDWDRPDELLVARGYFQTTNNRMELRACLFAHEWILERRDALDVQHVQIVTDSKYVNENYNRAMTWASSKWCNARGRTMLNADLWKDLIRVRRKIGGRPRVEIIQIPRRSSQIAKDVDDDSKAAAKAPHCMDSGFKPGKVGRARNNNRKAAQPYPAAGDERIVLVYGTAPLRRGFQKVKFQTYSGEERDFFDKFWAEAEDCIGNSLHRGNAFCVRMNALPNCPRILEIVATLPKGELIGTPSAEPTQ